MSGSESSSSSSGGDVVDRLRAAMRAGWWTVIIGALLVTFVWLVRLAVVELNLTFVATVWGISMDEVGRIFLDYIVICKLILLIAVLACVFLTMMVRELSR
jgi:hypothetical protein